MNNNPYKKLFITICICICAFMVLLMVVGSIYTFMMHEYTSFLNTYFAERREAGDIVVTEPFYINYPIAQGRDYVYNYSLLMMPIVGFILSLGIVISYLVCYKRASIEERSSINYFYLIFINIALGYLASLILSFSAGRYVSFVPGPLGLMMDTLLRWISFYLAFRFIFNIFYIIANRKEIGKKELILRIIYSGVSLIVFIFYLIMIIGYSPIGEALYLIIFGCAISPLSVIGFEGGLLYLKIA